MQKTSVAGCVFLLLLSGCVSESTIVGNDRPGQPRTDMTEAARTRMSLGLNYLQRGDNTQAKYNLEKAKQLAPDLADIDNALAYYYQQVGELEQAEDAYRDALRKDSNNADTYNNFGAFLCQHQKYQQAEELLLAAIKRPGYIRVADSYENLAFCSLEQKDYVKYHQYLKQSLQHNSNRSSALYNMAIIEYAMGNLAEAKKWQSRLHQLGQVSAEATLLRYIVAYYSGDITEQQTAEKFLISVYPTSAEASMILASDFSKSKPEQMRRDYKNSIVGDANSDSVKKGVVDQPKMKIVKRKSAGNTAAVAATAMSAANSESLPAETPLTVAQSSNVAAEVAAESTAEPSLLVVQEQVQSAAESVAKVPAEATINQTPTAETDSTAQLPNVTNTAEAAITDNKPQDLGVAQTEVAGTAVSEAEELAALQAPEPMPVETVTTAEKSAETVVTTDSSSDLAPTFAVQAEANSPVSGQNASSHTVASGETLYSIASRYRLSVSELQALNNLNDAALIKTGQVLKLTTEGAAEKLLPDSDLKPAEPKEVPVAPATYQVKEGESMFSISYKYNIKLDTLLKWNNMTVDKPLSIGQTIYLQDPATSSL